MLGRIGYFIFVLDTLALTAIGVFPENVKPVHYYASVAFFVLHPLSMFFFGATFLQMTKVKTGLFTFIVAIITAVMWTIQFTIQFGPNVAIPETLSALSASIWSMVLGFKMPKKDAH